MLHTTDKIIKHKVGLLNLAEELGNVSTIQCQTLLYYTFRERERETGSASKLLMSSING